MGASEADAGAMLKEERAATLTQFLVTGLVLQGGEEADGPLVSQDVQETHKFAVEAVGCRHNQREKGLVVVTEVVRTVCVALRLRHSRATSMMRSGFPATFKPLISKSPRRWPRLVGTRLPRLVRKPASCAMSAIAVRKSS